MQNLTNKIRAYVLNNALQEKDIAIACSGGVDSMVLVQALSEIYNPEKIFILHCDHGWHQRSSMIKESLEAYCKQKKLKFHSIRFDFTNLKKNEENARELRLKFFISKSEELSVRDIFLGHHLDDNVETVLFRLLRGTGVNGLRGISSKNTLDSAPLTLHRPLLGFEKAELQRYAESINLPVWEDPSNHFDTYSRNRIRLNIFPEAEKINPQFKNNIIRLSLLVQEQEAYINIQVEAALKLLGDLPWSLESLRSLDKLLQRKVLEHFFTHNLDFLNVFLDAIQAGGFHRINFEKNKFFTIKQKKIFLESLNDFRHNAS